MAFIGIGIAIIRSAQIVIETQWFGPALAIQGIAVFHSTHVTIIGTSHWNILTITRSRIARIRGTEIVVIAFHRRIGTFPGLRITVVNCTRVMVITFERIDTTFNRVTTIDTAMIFVITIYLNMVTSPGGRIAGVVRTHVLIVTIHGLLVYATRGGITGIVGAQVVIVTVHRFVLTVSQTSGGLYYAAISGTCVFVITIRYGIAGQTVGVTIMDAVTRIRVAGIRRAGIVVVAEVVFQLARAIIRITVR